MPSTLHNGQADAQPGTDRDLRQTPAFRPPKRRWPGLAATAVVALGLAAVGISSWNSRVDVEAQPAATSAGGTSGSADAQITQQVMKQIQADPSLAPLHIELKAEQGVVTLAGDVPDESTRARLAAIASMQSGVRGVENQLQLSSR